jgi:hypothetical protein
MASIRKFQPLFLGLTDDEVHRRAAVPCVLQLWLTWCRGCDAVDL